MKTEFTINIKWPFVVLLTLMHGVAYDGTICKPNQSDLFLVAIARNAITEY